VVYVITSTNWGELSQLNDLRFWIGFIIQGIDHPTSRKTWHNENWRLNFGIGIKIYEQCHGFCAYYPSSKPPHVTGMLVVKWGSGHWHNEVLVARGWAAFVWEGMMYCTPKYKACPNQSDQRISLVLWLACLPLTWATWGPYSVAAHYPLSSVYWSSMNRTFIQMLYLHPTCLIKIYNTWNKCHTTAIRGPGMSIMFTLPEPAHG
jgi:hypothetical protein